MKKPDAKFTALSRVSLICALFLSAAAAAFAQGDAVARELGGLRGALIGAASAEVAKNGEGSTVRLKDGALLHLFSRHLRPGAAADYPNPDLWPAVIAQTISRDQGRTWSTPEVLFRSTTGNNAMQPSLARLANGEIGVTYSRIDSLSRATKVFRSSKDEGRTWSEELLISPDGAYWTGAHDRLVVLSTGRVLYPLHTKLAVRPEKMGTRIAYSDDHGRSWKLAAQTIYVADAIPAHTAKFGQRLHSGFWEASIAERADGSLLMIGRTYGGFLYACTSTDKGLTWTTPAPTSLLSGAAPGRLERVPGTNDLIVVWNSCCLNPENGLLGDRLTLSAAFSSDGGQTWQGRREIESVAPGNNRRVEYPAVNIYDGVVYLTYRAQVGSGDALRMQEYLATLPLAWFYAERDYHRPAAAKTVKSRP